MEQAFGRVIAIRDADSSLCAEVEVRGGVTCARCASGRGCGAALLGASHRNRRVEARIGSGIEVREGDEVRIELSPRRLLLASWLVYGVPLFGALIAASAAHLAELQDPYTALAALSGVGAGLFVARRRLRRTACLQRFTPTIVARMAADR